MNDDEFKAAVKRGKQNFERSMQGESGVVNCADCQEILCESEREAARVCSGCRRLVHAECSLIGPQEQDLCESCYWADSEGFTFRMLKEAKA